MVILARGKGLGLLAGGYVRSFSTTSFDWLERSHLPELLAGAAPRFAKDGCAVIDDVLDDRDARIIRDQVRELFRSKASHVTPNTTFVVDVARQQTTLFPKRGIHEFDMISAGKTGFSLLDSMHEDSAFSYVVGSVLKLVDSDEIVTQNVKVQKNDGQGACFPIHYDTDGQYDARKLTCIYYLNEDPVGGELVLYPYGAPRIFVEPRLNRMVIFRSDVIAHRVLPCHAERYCLTIWCSGNPTSSTHEFDKEKLHLLVNALRAVSSDEQKQTIRDAIMDQPMVRKLMTKLALEDEWRQSLVDSHVAGTARDALLETFEAELESIRAFARLLG